ncbi:MAG: AtpZ/AtpI family protein [Verrucomicrobia bacterium]|nr:AtpZ/AtpI family protein [Verrucomicrobiota bacterium]
MARSASDDTDERQPANSPSPAIHLGLNFAVAMGFFSYLGYWLDEKHQTSPWWILCGVFLALIYGGYEVWKLTRTSSDDGAESNDT